MSERCNEEAIVDCLLNKRPIENLIRVEPSSANSLQPHLMQPDARRRPLIGLLVVE